MNGIDVTSYRIQVLNCTIMHSYGIDLDKYYTLIVVILDVARFTPFSMGYHYTLDIPFYRITSIPVGLP